VSDDARRRGGPQHIPRPPGTRIGDPAPWATLAAARRVDLADVRAALAAGGLDVLRPSPEGRRTSAVLIPLFEDGGELHVVLTRRSWHMRSHRGEVSFPGGGPEVEDADLVATALREAQEEVGLDPGAVTIIGELDHLSTVSSGSEIVPYVGALPGRPRLTPNPNEVDAILEVPVAELLLDEVYREEHWRWPGLDNRPLYFFELYGDTVWGATASILRQLLVVVTAALPDVER
jgi:8-oxo-dGTP pyrophosphatase MutT (NUDIX family)